MAAETIPGPRARKKAPPAEGQALSKPKPVPSFNTVGVPIGLVFASLGILFWLGTLGLAMWENSQDPLPIPRKVKHNLMMFDKIFRMVGPIIPFVIVAPRSVLPDLITTPRGVVVQRGSVLGGPLVTISYYLGLTLLRAAIYVIVAAMMPKSMADHVFLGASVFAMLNSEATSCVKQYYDLRGNKAKIEDEPDYEHAPKRKYVRLAGYTKVVLVGRVALAVLATLLASLVLADMYYTARYFHAVPETAISIVAGLVCFQIPLAVYIHFLGEWQPDHEY